jgi:hypothetical protein
MTIDADRQMIAGPGAFAHQLGKLVLAFGRETAFVIPRGLHELLNNPSVAWITDGMVASPAGERNVLMKPSQRFLEAFAAVRAYDGLLPPIGERFPAIILGPHIVSPSSSAETPSPFAS